MADPIDVAGTAAAAADLASSLGDLTDLSKLFGQSLSTALKGAVVQGKALDTVLRGLAERLASRALDAALSPLTSAIGGGIAGLLGGLLGFAHGGVLAGGRVRPFAAGGIVAAPTWFPMADGRTGLMGEAGAEAILPLARGTDGRLGVAAGGSSVTHVVVNITTPDPGAFRRSEAQVTGMVARAVGRGRRGL